MVSELSKVVNFREVFYFYILGEEKGKKLLKPLIQNERYKQEVITEIADLRIYITDKTTHPRFGEIKEDITRRIIGNESQFLADTKSGLITKLEKYRSYLKRAVQPTLRELIKAYQ
jgi:hypothetical protein